MHHILICLLTLLFSLSGPAMGVNNDFGRWSNAAKGGARTSFWSKAEFNGTRVYQRNDLIDATLVDARGRTNLQRMQSGLAPISLKGQTLCRNFRWMLERRVFIA